jgi:hypothetical protein
MKSPRLKLRELDLEFNEAVEKHGLICSVSFEMSRNLGGGVASMVF